MKSKKSKRVQKWKKKERREIHKKIQKDKKLEIEEEEKEVEGMNGDYGLESHGGH